jgi:acetyltransferase-like isoleucine patch superfamily enzyme
MTRLQRRLADCYQRLRIAKLRLLSDCKNVFGHPTIRQPLQFLGQGTIRFGGTANLGWFPSPYFSSGYIYIEARSADSLIQIEDGVNISNNSFPISDGAGSFIGNRTMLGIHCEVIDSDFHDLHPDRRSDGVAKTGKVVIGENVLIGSNVKILKGVRIGSNVVIANGSVVTRSIPANATAFGNSARAGLGLMPEETAVPRTRSETPP